MNDTFPNERLSAYLDGELEADEATRLEQELADDASLREEYEALRSAVELVREQGPVDAPADFHAKLMARVSLLEAPPLTLWQRLRELVRGVPLEGLAVALAAAMVVIILVDQPKQSAPVDAEAEPATVATNPTPIAPEPPVAAKPAIPTPPPTPRLATNEPAPTPIPLSDERNDVLDEIMGAPAAERDQDGVALAPAVAPETSATTVERQVSDAMRAVLTLRVRTDDPLALQQISRLAGQFQGTATDVGGGALSTQRLSQAGMTSVRVRLPANQLTAFQMKAKGLGTVEVLARQNTNLYGTAPIEVLVEVDYRP